MKELIHGYLDGELDLAGSLEIERHIKDCTACARDYAGQKSLRSAIARSALYHRAPDDLRHRIHAVLRREAPQPSPFRLSRRVLPWAPLGAVAAALALAIPVLLRQSAENRVSDEIVSAHIRSLMPGHLIDIPSSDQHTVKPWFNGRLDFSPPVRDLAAQGFPLVGGRLDYAAGRPVAVVVYQRRKHVINLFIWPGVPDERVVSRQGYNLIRWKLDSMAFCAVSDLNAAELRDFARLVRNP